MISGSTWTANYPWSITSAPSSVPVSSTLAALNPSVESSVPMSRRVWCRLLWQPEWTTATPFWQHFLMQSSIDQLQRVQNAAARLITGTGTREHITPALRSLHWLPVKFRITFKLCVLMHLVHIGRAPAYLSDIVTATDDLPGRGRLRSSNTFRYELPIVKRKFGERGFSYAGPKAWNNLPPALQELTDTCTFKRQLKTHLFTLAYT